MLTSLGANNNERFELRYGVRDIRTTAVHAISQNGAVAQG